MRYIKSLKKASNKRLIRSNLLAPCVLYAMLILLSLMSGCQWLQKQPDDFEQISEEDLRQALNNYEELFIAKIKEIARELNELIAGAENRKKTLYLKKQLISACRATLAQEDSIAAFADSWVLAVRLVEYFETGHGSDLFGQYQDIAINRSKQNLEHIETIGSDFLDKEAFDKAQTKIYDFAQKHPIGKNYAGSVTFASKSKKVDGTTSTNMFSLSVTPFNVAEGVTQGMVGTRKLTNTAEHFTDIIEVMPESIRWQLTLLLDDMEQMETIKSVSGSMAEFAESSSRFAGTTEKLPEQLRKELSILTEQLRKEATTLLDEIDVRQTNLQVTIEKVGAIVAEIDDLTLHMNWRAMQLVTFIFVLALAYQIVLARFVCKHKKGTGQ